MRRSKRRRWSVWLAAVLLVIAVLALFVLATGKTEMTFEESGRELNNPMRGYYIQVDSAKHKRIADLDEVRLVFLAFDIESFADGPISEEKIEELRNALETAEESGKAIIFRAAYGFKSDVTEPDNLQTISLHIQQISEVLNKFAGNIVVVQAGMYGAYGEWHSSIYLEKHEEDAKENRLFLLQQWEKYLDHQIKVAVRRPRFIREASEKGVLKARLGLHNDALLSTDSDMGTYDDPEMDRESELIWSSNELEELINGGEMPTPGVYSKPENAHSEFQKLHLTYLNLKYNEEILNQWEETEFLSSNAKNYIGDHLGYRLYISGIEYRKPVLNLKSFLSGIQMEVELCNSGYAPLGRQYKVYTVIKSEGTVIRQTVNLEEIYSASNGEKVKFVLKIPKEVAARDGEFLVGIKLALESEETNSEACVELANENIQFIEGVNYFITFAKNGARTNSRVWIK